MGPGEVGIGTPLSDGGEAWRGNGGSDDEGISYDVATDVFRMQPDLRWLWKGAKMGSTSAQTPVFMELGHYKKVQGVTSLKWTVQMCFLREVPSLYRAYNIFQLHPI